MGSMSSTIQNAALTCLMLLISVLMITMLLPSAKAYIIKDKELKINEYDSYELSGNMNDVWSISFSITNGSKADVYIMRYTEYNERYPDGNFSTSFSRENVPLFDEKWTQPDEDNYYLIIDNVDNAYNSDTVPIENITYDLTYYNHPKYKNLGGGDVYRNQLLNEGGAYYKGLYGNDGDTYDITVDVREGATIDVYIMSTSEFDNYRKDKYFRPVFTRVNISRIDKEWTQPDDQDYYLVIDNLDNSQPDDTQPEGEILFDIEIHDEDGFEIFESIRYIVLGVVVLFVIIVIGLTWLILRKGPPLKRNIFPANKPVFFPPGPPIPPMYPPPAQHPPQQPPGRRPSEKNKKPPEYPEY